MEELVGAAEERNMKVKKKEKKKKLIEAQILNEKKKWKSHPRVSMAGAEAG